MNWMNQTFLHLLKNQKKGIFYRIVWICFRKKSQKVLSLMTIELKGNHFELCFTFDGLIIIKLHKS